MRLLGRGLKRNFLLITFAAALGCGCSHQNSGSATDVGRGGDIVAIEFLNVATQTIAQIEIIAKATPSSIPSNVSLQRLKDVLKTVSISSTERVYVSDVEKDAVNYASLNRIVVSRSRWQAIGAAKLKAALTLHELLPLSGVSDENYLLSSQLMTLLDPSETVAPRPAAFNCSLQGGSWTNDDASTGLLAWSKDRGELKLGLGNIEVVISLENYLRLGELVFKFSESSRVSEQSAFCSTTNPARQFATYFRSTDGIFWTATCR